MEASSAFPPVGRSKEAPAFAVAATVVGELDPSTVNLLMKEAKDLLRAAAKLRF